MFNLYRFHSRNRCAWQRISWTNAAQISPKQCPPVAPVRIHIVFVVADHRRIADGTTLSPSDRIKVAHPVPAVHHAGPVVLLALPITMRHDDKLISLFFDWGAVLALAYHFDKFAYQNDVQDTL